MEEKRRRGCLLEAAGWTVTKLTQGSASALRALGAKVTKHPEWKTANSCAGILAIFAALGALSLCRTLASLPPDDGKLYGTATTNPGVIYMPPISPLPDNTATPRPTEPVTPPPTATEAHPFNSPTPSLKHEIVPDDTASQVIKGWEDKQPLPRPGCFRYFPPGPDATPTVQTFEDNGLPGYSTVDPGIYGIIVEGGQLTYSGGECPGGEPK